MYIAPELLQARPSTHCDVFSLGLVLYELAAQIELPALAPSGSDAWHRLRAGELSFPPAPERSAALRVRAARVRATPTCSARAALFASCACPVSLSTRQSVRSVSQSVSRRQSGRRTPASSSLHAASTPRCRAHGLHLASPTAHASRAPTILLAAPSPSPPLKELVLRCCAPEPTDRPSAAEVEAKACACYEALAQAEAAQPQLPPGSEAPRAPRLALQASADDSGDQDEAGGPRRMSDGLVHAGLGWRSAHAAPCSGSNGASCAQSDDRSLLGRELANCQLGSSCARPASLFGDAEDAEMSSVADS